MLSLGEQDALIGGLAVGEVWGVGRQIGARLAGMGVATVRQLRDADPLAILRQFSVVLERTVLELRGISCLALEEVVPPRQQIMVSRSFGNPVYDLAGLEQAVATFVGRAAEKLRGQGSCAGGILVFAQTSPFRDEPQYSRSLTVPVAVATDDTLALTGAALAGLALIYRDGFAYAKAGVMLSGLVDRDRVPRDLFAAELQRKRPATTVLNE